MFVIQPINEFKQNWISLKADVRYFTIPVTKRLTIIREIETTLWSFQQKKSKIESTERHIHHLLLQKQYSSVKQEKV